MSQENLLTTLIELAKLGGECRIDFNHCPPVARHLESVPGALIAEWYHRDHQRRRIVTDVSLMLGAVRVSASHDRPATVEEVTRHEQSMWAFETVRTLRLYTVPVAQG